MEILQILFDLFFLLLSLAGVLFMLVLAFAFICRIGNPYDQW